MPANLEIWKLGVLQSMGSQRVRHDWATELNWTDEEGNGNSLQYSCLENPTDRVVWQLQSMGSQRNRHELAIINNININKYIYMNHQYIKIYMYIHTHIFIDIKLEYTVYFTSNWYYMCVFSYIHNFGWGEARKTADIWKCKLVWMKQRTGEKHY